MTSNHLYLAAKYIRKPKYPDQTHKKGYWDNPDNARWDEVLEFHTRIRDETKYNIIIDLVDQKVIKNGLSDNYSWEQLSQYYFDRYPQEIMNAIQKYHDSP